LRGREGIEQKYEGQSIECKRKALAKNDNDNDDEYMDSESKLKDGCGFKGHSIVYLSLCFFLYSDKILSALVMFAAGSHLSSANE